MAIKPEQFTAARALCRLSQKRLAELSGVGLATIKRIERQSGDWPARKATIDALLRIFEEHGVEFREDGESYGLMKRKDQTNE